MTEATNGKATETELGDLHGKITRTLDKALDGTEVSAAVLANAIAWMKHNDITADPEANDALTKLKAKLKARGRKDLNATDIAAAQLELERQMGLGGPTGSMQ